MCPDASPLSRTARDRPSICTIRNRRWVGTGGSPRRRRRMKRSIARWTDKASSSRDIVISLEEWIVAVLEYWLSDAALLYSQHSSTPIRFTPLFLPQPHPSVSASQRDLDRRDRRPLVRAHL